MLFMLPQMQSETIFWNPITYGEPFRSGEFFVTCAGEGSPVEVTTVIYEDGVWTIGYDDEDMPIDGSAGEFEIVAWALLPAGYRV
jgi:hypothetical protein